MNTRPKTCSLLQSNNIALIVVMIMQKFKQFLISVIPKNTLFTLYLDKLLTIIE